MRVLLLSRLANNDLGCKSEFHAVLTNQQHTFIAMAKTSWDLERVKPSLVTWDDHVHVLVAAQIAF